MELFQSPPKVTPNEIQSPMITKVKIRTCRFELRLTEHECNQLKALEKASGVSRSDIVRLRVLRNSDKTLIHGGQLIQKLDTVGVELSRAGNNINQLARHANTLDKRGEIHMLQVSEVDRLLGEHIKLQRELEVLMRQIIRMIKS